MLASLGLLSVTVGAWMNQYRLVFVAATMTLLGISFYRTYTGKGNISPWSKRILWITAIVSIGLTVYSIMQSMKT